MTGTTAARPLAPPRTSGGERTVLVAPALPDGARKAWRRLVTSVGAGVDAYAFEGAWLSPGVAYDVPVGAVVLVVDAFPERWEVRMTRAGTGELETVKEWELKSPLGKRVVDFVRRRLPADARAHRALRCDPAANAYAGRCLNCRQEVAAGAGRLQTDTWGTTRVAHTPGTCPPRPAVIRPNRRSEHCLLCGRWVARGQGVALLLEAPEEVTGRRYRAAHDDGCPLDAPAGPPNLSSGWCADCGELTEPEQGYWGDGALHHRRCPTATVDGSTWIVRQPRDEPVLAAGQVRRLRVDLRRGTETYVTDDLDAVTVRRPDNPPVPLEAAGVRVLSETYVEMVGVVLECVRSRRGRVRARVRVATGVEAAALLAREAAQAVEARPDAGGFKAVYSAMRYVDKPWLAELTGRDADFGYARLFQSATVDYTHANRSGRGAEYEWVLRPNAVYEACYWTSRTRQHRVFLRATAEGTVTGITKEEVEAWLNAAPLWPDH
ncbi:hypothetical protein [Streptomyces pinistramenti]|uniref:hypothetical protein n=1 Tax=Streptomyces pinistramenti TaxID=2884812 RepID=UPI001D088F3D|nr:hypothetical protein [Streptomyces pinistramenti]MCB5910344.1 hypothetical protein [Streptomyces pinistramenti]